MIFTWLTADLKLRGKTHFFIIYVEKKKKNEL